MSRFKPVLPAIAVVSELDDIVTCQAIAGKARELMVERPSLVGVKVTPIILDGDGNYVSVRFILTFSDSVTEYRDYKIERKYHRDEDKRSFSVGEEIKRGELARLAA